MSENKYHSEYAQRLLAAIPAMAGKEVVGITPKELSAAIQCTAAQATNVLANLIEAGTAEELPSLAGRYRLTVQFVQVANAVSLGITNAQQQLQLMQSQYGGLADDIISK